MLPIGSSSSFSTAIVVWPDGSPFDGFLWDHWRIGTDSGGLPLFGALLDYGAGWRQRLAAETHHFASSWALLRRTAGPPLERFEIVQPDLLCGNPEGPDDGSVWSGSGFQTVHAPDGGAPEPVFALFYTARRLLVPRAILGVGAELDQEIRLAVLRREPMPGTDPVWRVHRTQLVLRPDPARHVTSEEPGPTVVPAFRDPFVFVDGAGRAHLVVATREREGPVDNDASLTFYRVDGPLDDPLSYRLEGRYAPGRYLEIECPHVGRAEDGRLVLTFSTGGLGHTPEATASPVGQLLGAELPLDEQGALRFEDGELKLPEPTTALGPEVGLYAGWIDGGAVRGFAWKGGGLCRAGPAPWRLTEDTDLRASTRLAAPLGRATQLTDRTHQWDLRRAALFVRDLDAAQREALVRGKPLLAVLNPAQRKRLDDFYAGRI